MKNRQKITYCLWFNQRVEEAVKFYTHAFNHSKLTAVMNNLVDTPSGKEGTVLTEDFEIEGQSFVVLNGGSQFQLNPSISFFIYKETAEEIDELWHKLTENGKVLMPLDKYPFSDRYGWVQDQFGVSWQLMLPQGSIRQRVMPSLLFVNEVYGKAEEAIKYYTEIFKNTQTGNVARYPAGMAPDKEGTIMFADFMLEGQWFAAMDSGHKHPFHFNEAISFVVHCETQDEIDYYWDKLTKEGKALQCGWLKDKYGVAWQIVPDSMLKLLKGNDKEKAKRAMEAMMKMVKLDIATLMNA